MLGLVGCTTGTGVSDQTITNVQRAVIQACQFYPTVETIRNIFASGDKALQDVSNVANAICQAVALKGRAADGTRPKVNGVEVDGLKL